MNTENGRTTVTILGSGTCVPSLQRSSSAVLVETGNEKLLFDAGPGTMRRLLEAGHSIFDISHLFLSHFHPDHSGELVPLLFATKYPDQHQRKKPLTIIAGSGFASFYGCLQNVYGDWIELAPGMMDIVEFSNRSNDARRFANFAVESCPVEHRAESVAFRITDHRGKSMVYSGDTDVSDNLVALAKNADLFICESALPDELKTKGHLTPCLAGEMATRAAVRELILTHFYPVCDTVDIKKQCRRTYAGPLRLAQDLLTIKL
jgi:ribonuclease BN (tRNA processing enzyme)